MGGGANLTLSTLNGMHPQYVPGGEVDFDNLPLGLTILCQSKITSFKNEPVVYGAYGTSALNTGNRVMYVLTLGFELDEKDLQISTNGGVPVYSSTGMHKLQLFWYTSRVFIRHKTITSPCTSMAPENISPTGPQKWRANIVWSPWYSIGSDLVYNPVATGKKSFSTNSQTSSPVLSFQHYADKKDSGIMVNISTGAIYYIHRAASSPYYCDSVLPAGSYYYIIA